MLVEKAVRDCFILGDLFLLCEIGSTDTKTIYLAGDSTRPNLIHRTSDHQVQSSIFSLVKGKVPTDILRNWAQVESSHEGVINLSIGNTQKLLAYSLLMFSPLGFLFIIWNIWVLELFHVDRMKYRLVQSIRVYLTAGRMFSIEFWDKKLWYLQIENDVRRSVTSKINIFLVSALNFPGNVWFCPWIYPSSSSDLSWVPDSLQSVIRPECWRPSPGMTVIMLVINSVE